MINLVKHSQKYKDLAKKSETLEEQLLKNDKKYAKLKEDYDTLDLGFQFNEYAMSEMMSNLADIPHIELFYKKQIF